MTLFLGVWFLAGCGDGIPTPWVERRGQVEVVGNPANVDQGSDPEQAAPSTEQQNATRRVDDDVPDGLGAVDADYASLAESGEIESCPEGTSLRDERKTKYQVYCATAEGVHHGPFLLWHNNGQVKEVGPYQGGKRHGTWQTFSKDGSLYSVYQWENGAPVSGEVIR